MAKKWTPKVGETYIVRSSDNGAGGYFFGVIHVTRVIGNPAKYHGKGGPYCRVAGTYMAKRGDVSSDNDSWCVGKAGLVGDKPVV